MSNESIVSPRLQKAVAKLAANEYFAAQYYMLAPFATAPEQRSAVAELFTSMETQARSARFARLAGWMDQYGVPVPSSDAEMRRHATPDVARLSQLSKKKLQAGDSLERAQKIEAAIMAAYKEVVGSDGVAYFTDLQSMLWQNYYDHGDEAGKLQTAKVAVDAGCDLVMN